MVIRLKTALCKKVAITRQKITLVLNTTGNKAEPLLAYAEMWKTATRHSANKRRRTSCVSAPGFTSQTSTPETARSSSPSISQIEWSRKSNVVASGRQCWWTMDSTFFSTSGFGIRTPVEGSTNSPDMYFVHGINEKWHRAKSKTGSSCFRFQSDGAREAQ